MILFENAGGGFEIRDLEALGNEGFLGGLPGAEFFLMGLVGGFGCGAQGLLALIGGLEGFAGLGLPSLGGGEGPGQCGGLVGG